jgi:acetyl-CoA acyltransferase
MLFPKLLKRTGVASEEIDDCITGVSNGVGENWTYGGRLPVFLSNFSEHESFGTREIFSLGH